jgi:hypothetical protein
MVVELNPGQQRKIRIIEKIFGLDWREQYPEKAIDAVYNLAIQDDRKSVFCKIDRNHKEKLEDMLEIYGTTMGEFISTMIDEYHTRFLRQQHDKVTGIADDYSGTERIS